ncbi:MAG TPA: Hsp20/alpha crystallin family protein [Acidimicrobiales bacterium]|nr:Hsp20/alpha crystallin family protein [Acidimicrobiales bacterium]
MSLTLHRFPDLGDLMDDRLPRIEEFQEDHTVVVRFEMPGIDPDNDVEITVTDGVLRIKAERREETKSDDTHAYRSEFRYGSYSRGIQLPAGASEDDVKASYKDGILEVRVPMSDEKAEAKKIPVTRA